MDMHTDGGLVPPWALAALLPPSLSLSPLSSSSLPLFPSFSPSYPSSFGGVLMIKKLFLL